MKLELKVALLVSLIQACLTFDRLGIIDFLRSNGFTKVTFLRFSLANSVSLAKLASKNWLQARYAQELDGENQWDFLVVDLMDNDLDSILETVHDHQAGKILFVIDQTEKFIQKLRLKVSNENIKGLFYIYDDTGKWKQILAIQNQLAINDVYFDSQGRAKVNENLQGMELETTTLTWDPFIVVENCNANGKNCQIIEGALVDLANEWSTVLNFTWSVVQDDDVGTLPKSGISKKPP